MRHRKNVEGGDARSTPEEDVDTLLRHHNELQDKIAEEMLYYAHSLKENARAAGRIVQEDNRVSGQVGRSSERIVVREIIRWVHQLMAP